MRLLALDTSSIACSVAVQVGSKISERYEEQPREHTRLLLPMIASVLEEQGVKLADLDAIVLGNGPGSFIGMRIAASVAQGLAFASGLKIVPVSSLAVVACQVMQEHKATEVIVTQDAHMGEVYVGRFRPDAENLPVAAVAEYLHGQSRLPDLADDPRIRRLGAGSGWQRYPNLLDANRQVLDEIVAASYPSARHLLALGAAGLKRGDAIDPDQVMPAYLREKVAEVPARP